MPGNIFKERKWRQRSTTRKVGTVLCVFTALLLLLLPLTADAWWGAAAIANNKTAEYLNGVAYDWVSSALYWLASAMAALAGVVIALESWFLQVILALSFNLVNSAPVKLGFPVVLSIANLAFVAGLVVIAIATILRQQSYGMKKILWKLVVMAIAVNFGLVICGALLRVSDDIALYFIESVNPIDAEGDGDFGVFVSSIAGAFNPQGALVGHENVTYDPAEATAAFEGAALGQEVGKFLLPFSALLGSIGALFIIIVTLGVLIAMLLVRYVKLGMLMITLPLAWTAFVFPAYNEHFKKWWGDFTKWTVFPPVVVFFLWLSLKISEQMNAPANGSEYDFTKYQSPGGDGIWAALASFFTGVFSPTIEQILRILIIWGIMMGGLTAAQKLGITFADAGIKAVEGGKKWGLGRLKAAGGVGGRYAKRGVRAGYQKARGSEGRTFDQWLAQNKMGQGIQNRFGRALVTTLGSGAAVVGRGIGKKAQKGGADIVEEQKKTVPKTADEIRKELEGNNEMPRVLALLSSLSPDDLSKVSDVGGMPLLEWLKRYGGKIDDYKQIGLEENLKKIGLPPKAVEKMKAGKWEEAVQGDEGVLDKVKPQHANRLFDEKPFGMSGAEAEEFHKAVIYGLKERMAPQQFGTMVAELSKKQLDKFKDVLQGAIDAEGGGRAGAEVVLGKDIPDYMRDNGGVRSRSVRSEMWGEKGRAGTNEDIAQGSGSSYRVSSGQSFSGPTSTTPPPTGPSNTS